MASFLIVVMVLVAAWYVIGTVQRRRRGLVAERGMSIGADLATMADQPRVRVREVAKAGPDRVRLVLTWEPGPDDVPGPSPELELLVFLRDDEFGFEQLQEWERSGSALAIVLPPQSLIVRLRSLDDLQPLTLRRVEGT